MRNVPPVLRFVPWCSMPSVTFNPYGWIQSKEKVDTFVGKLNTVLSKCEEPSLSEELERLKEEVLTSKMYNSKMEWLLSDIESRIDKEMTEFFSQFDV